MTGEYIIILLSVISFILILMCFRKNIDYDNYDNSLDLEKINNMENIEDLRILIDKVDRNIVRNIHKRSIIVKRIWELKENKGFPRYDKTREKQILQKIRSYAKERDLNEEKVVNIYSSIVGGHF